MPSAAVPSTSPANNQTGFRPMLLKVEVSADIINPDHDLWVTSWWQNTGDAPAALPVQGFLEAEFGHQRLMETAQSSFRIIWDPMPGPQHWQPGGVYATTCRWHIKTQWNGTFKLYLGLYDPQRVPIPVTGPDHMPMSRVYIGNVNVGWGWGEAVLQQTQQPWTKEFHSPVPVPAAQPTAKSVVIGSTLRATLAADAPVVHGLTDGIATFAGTDQLPEIVIRDRATDAVRYSFTPELDVRYTVATDEPLRRDYAGVATVAGTPVAQWTLAFSVDGRQLAVTLDQIQETEGFELLEVRLPALASVAGPDARMVNFFGGGRLIAPEDARPIGYVHPYDARNAAALYDPHGTLVLEAPGMDDKLCASVQQDLAGKRAVLGAVLTYRIRGYGEVASIAVINPPRITLDLLDAAWGAPGWQSTARFLRKDLKSNAYKSLYDRVLFNKFLVSFGPQPEPWQLTDTAPFSISKLATFHTFAEAEERMRRNCHLTDGAPQIFYVTGWEYEGFDTGYPYVYQTDPRLGTIEDLRHCIDAGPQYNAHVGMHDNYDDCYPSVHYDGSMTAIGEDGQPWRGWVWAGGQSYIMGFHKYARSGEMQERVRKTVELFGLRDTYHLDVLSSEVRHYDFDPAYSAAADLNHQAKLELIRTFNQYGVDITSETLTHPFVGALGFAWSTRDDLRGVLFPGERYIPLTGMIYHGTIPFGYRLSGDMGLLWGMINGGAAAWSEEPGHDETDVRGFYLVTLPICLLGDRKIEDIREDGQTVRTVYSEDTYVTVDLTTRQYEIVIDGRVVGRGWTTFAPGFKPGSYLAYARNGGELSYPAPAGWQDGIELRAVTITGDGEGEELACAVIDGQFVMQMPAATPVRVMQR